MRQDTYDKMKQEQLNSKGLQFIDGLLEAGIPLSAIMTSDWRHCSTQSIVVTVPYGKRKGGQHIERIRFQERDLQSTIKQWKESV